MITNLTNEIESVTLSLPKTVTKVSRRKSYPNRDEQEKPEPAQEVAEGETSSKEVPNKKNKILKTKSGSKSDAISAAMEKFVEKSVERLSPVKSICSKKTSMNGEDEQTDTSKTKIIKKPLKISKKKVTDKSQSPTKNGGEKTTNQPTVSTKSNPEKPPEKKLIRSGFLNSIAQKFEKMRENSKSKEKKMLEMPLNGQKGKQAEKSIKPVEPKSSTVLKESVNVEKAVTDAVSQKPETLKQTTVNDIPPKADEKGQSESTDSNRSDNVSEKSQKTYRSHSSDVSRDSESHKSHIDAVIRHLHDRFKLYNTQADDNEAATESGLIKRAVSVEDISNDTPTFNKYNVNKVLGLFKQIEQEQQQKLLKDRLMYNILDGQSADVKERPRSSGFVSKPLLKKGKPYYCGAKSDTLITLTDQLEKQLLADKAKEKLNTKSEVVNGNNGTKIPALKATLNLKVQNPCGLDCGTNGCQNNNYNMVNISQPNNNKIEIEKHSVPSLLSTASDKSERERTKNNRKGLILNLNDDNEFDVTFNIKLNKNNKESNGNSNNNKEPGYHQHIAEFIDNSAIDSNKGNDKSIYNNNNNFSYPMYPDNSAPVTPIYSSDSRSFRDDCDSTSTFLSPSDEPEIYFDDCSQCSCKYTISLYFQLFSNITFEFQVQLIIGLHLFLVPDISSIYHPETHIISILLQIILQNQMRCFIQTDQHHQIPMLPTLLAIHQIHLIRKV